MIIAVKVHAYHNRRTPHLCLFFPHALIIEQLWGNGGREFDGVSLFVQTMEKQSRSSQKMHVNADNSINTGNMILMHGDLVNQRFP